MPQHIVEARPSGAGTPLVENASGRLEVQIITPGWGSSGYYSPKVLEAAAGPAVFPAGTHMYLDHPTASEGYERPERSVRDLAAVLTSDARWDGQALVAEVQTFGPYRDVLAEMRDTIGVSIRASAEVETGEAEGRRGQIVTALVEGTSVDFVTHAGRGGRILQVLESARGEALTASTARAQLLEARNVGQWIESRLHLNLTQIADEMFGDGRLTRDERIALSSAVGDGLQAFTASLEASSPQLYARDLWDEPTALLAALEAAHQPPVIPAGQSTTPTESQEDTMPQIEEARLSQLEADAGRVPTLTTERDTALTRAETAERMLAESTARNAARPVIAAVLAESATPLPPATVARLTEGLAASVPLTDAGALDEAALRTAVEAARTAAETEVSAIAESLGVGKPSGLGGGSTPTGEVTESAYETKSAGVFGRQTVKGA